MKDFLSKAFDSLRGKYLAAPDEKNHYTYPELARLELEKKSVSGAVKAEFVLPKGVEAYPLVEACEIFPTEVRIALEKIVSRPLPPEHKFYCRAKLEGLNSGGAFFVRVPERTRAYIEVSIPQIAEKEFPALFTIFSIGENSQVKILERASLSQGLCSTEVFCAPNSSAEFVSISQAPVQTKEHALLSHKRFFVEENASPQSYSAFLGGGLAKAETEMVLQAPGASSRDCQSAFASSQQHFDLSSTVRHEARSTKAHSFVKSVIADKARAVLWGKIFIAKGAKLSDSFLRQNAVMLNPGARADAMPMLEIDENDVRATHASSVSHVDEGALYYLGSRGIPVVEAKKAIASSFLGSAFEKSSLEEAKKSLELAIEGKWQ